MRPENPQNHRLSYVYIDPANTLKLTCYKCCHSSSMSVNGLRKFVFGSALYCSVPGKRPLPGKRPCAEFRGVTVAASIQTWNL